MKFSSAVTVTTVLSILSATHGAPVLSVKEAPDSAPVHGHYRRASSVSELAGRQYTGSDHLDGLNFAHEGSGSHIKNLFNFVKRQLGSSASTNTASSPSTQIGSSPVAEQTGTGQSQPGNAAHAMNGLMGGGNDSPEEAGFAFEPGQGIRGLLP